MLGFMISEQQAMKETGPPSQRRRERSHKVGKTKTLGKKGKLGNAVRDLKICLLFLQ